MSRRATAKGGAMTVRGCGRTGQAGAGSWPQALTVCLALVLPTGAALGADHPSPPAAPVVGTLVAGTRPVTQTRQFTGRVQAIDSVALIPRVTAFLDERLFKEGSEVHKGDLLYKLEQGPFQANVLTQQGAVAQARANTVNSGIQLQRQKNLESSPAFAKENFDNAVASARGNVGGLLSAQGNLQYAQIQLDYTEIRAPIDGRITATAVNPGNVVSPNSGALATIVSQDPMYVVFPAATRDLLTMRSSFASQGGLGAAKLTFTLADGSIYDQTGKLDYVAPTVAQNTDTLNLRATVANPLRGAAGSGTGSRALFDGEFVTVTVGDPQPQTQLVVPRAAVLADQQGAYLYGVDDKSDATRIDITLGNEDGTDVVVTKGLKDGQTFIADGIQRVHLGQKVDAKPMQKDNTAPAAHG